MRRHRVVVKEETGTKRRRSYKNSGEGGDEEE